MVGHVASPLDRTDFRTRSAAREPNTILLARGSIALVWLYQGLWNKLLGGHPDHAALMAAMPGVGPARAPVLLALVGFSETLLALWVLSERQPRRAAVVQTIGLVAMNAGGLAWGLRWIADPGAMIVQNLAFLALIWTVAERRVDRDASRT